MKTTATKKTLSQIVEDLKIEPNPDVGAVLEALHAQAAQCAKPTSAELGLAAAALVARCEEIPEIEARLTLRAAFADESAEVAIYKAMEAHIAEGQALDSFCEDYNAARHGKAILVPEDAVALNALLAGLDGAPDTFELELMLDA